MTEKEAVAIVNAAMTVIVDHILGKNSHPSEGYQDKYRKVDAVTDEVVSVLSAAVAKPHHSSKVVVAKSLALDILKYKSHLPVSWLATYTEPERWMFRRVR